MVWLVGCALSVDDSLLMQQRCLLATARCPVHFKLLLQLLKAAQSASQTEAHRPILGSESASEFLLNSGADSRGPLVMINRRERERERDGAYN